MTEGGFRLGLFGGTFNPIHYGHLRAAEETAERFGLSRVVFVPAGRPPHKSPHPVTSFHHRLAMTRLAVAGRPGFCVDNVEGGRSGPSYTVDTLSRFRDLYGEESAPVFLTGLDAFLDVHGWKESAKLFHLATFIVFDRPGYDSRGLARYVRERIGADYCHDTERGVFTSPDKQPIHFLNITGISISSTDIRRRVRNGLSIRYLTPDPVREYIVSNGLYREDPEGGMSPT